MERALLPAGSVLELAGILTLLTNESLIGPVDVGIQVPAVLPANIQGFGLLAAGFALIMYAIYQMS